MKTVIKYPAAPETGRKYWRSLNEFADTPEFRQWLEREFPAGAAEFNGGEVSRRNFIRLMGASTALAGIGLTSCRRPEKHLVPFTNSIEWSVPGKPLFYATSMPARRGAIPLVVTTYDGRPTKIEGNPLHPATRGSTDTFAQASILDLYDPDRARSFVENGKETTPERFDAAIDQLMSEIAGAGGGGLAFLVEENNSPTRERLRAEVQKKFPGTLWAVYEPLGGDKTVAQQFGTMPTSIEGADVIVALDCDFLGCEEGSIQNVRAFTSRRRVSQPGDKMNRLYVVENHYTTTGGMADHRLRCPASQVGAFALALAERLGAAPQTAAGQDPTTPKPRVAAKFVEGWVEETAKDLLAAKAKGLVVAGSRQPAAVHEIVRAINTALGNTANQGHAPGTGTPTETIADLARAITDKKVRALFILGGNPAYNAPADLEWTRLQHTVPYVVRLGQYQDETSQRVTWHVPAAHYLESWGDARSVDGTYLAIQPMILPLYRGLSEIDLLARILGQPKPTGPEVVQETFRQLATGDNSDAAWSKFLHDGFLADSALPVQPLAPPAAATATPGADEEESDAALSMPVMAGTNALEVVFLADASVDDGRYANNGWLQEAPDPVTKLTWDNAALVSPTTAQLLGLNTSDVVQIKLDDQRKIEAPVMVAPGHADHSISIALGYGRTVTGRIGRGAGVNAYPLRTTAQPYFAVGAEVTKTGKTYPLAVTQEHHSMEGRALVREGTLEHFAHEPDFAQKMGMDDEKPPGGYPSLYRNPPLDGLHQWGMTVDLNTCIGCNACVVACQAENNIPIVGKEQVANGREMHWIRNDRYFSTADEHDQEPEMVTQPMLCQHCENAPCETVCPVNATVHNTEGLNVMAYNRCIGTRYCSNNCPFKVRRFNFFDYHQRPLQERTVGPLKAGGLHLGPLVEKGSPETLQMQKNPNVTVRMRGVMEKCTFCVQRIQEAKIAQKVKAGASDDVKIPTDAFMVACQQACPSDSIVFGDISDPESKVSKLKEQERNYRLLEFLNVKTRVSYLARIRNPNMRMPGAHKIAASTKAHKQTGEKHPSPEGKAEPGLHTPKPAGGAS